MDDKTKKELQSATLDRLISHLRERKDVQNIDLMNLAGFCRNCLSKWYAAEARDQGIDLDLEAAREIVYGMPYGEWKRHQAPASPEQQAAYEESKQRFPESH